VDGDRDDYDLGYNAVRYCLGWSVLAYLVRVVLWLCNTTLYKSW
jgi:hypothetical protein